MNHEHDDEVYLQPTGADPTEFALLRRCVECVGCVPDSVLMIQKYTQLPMKIMSYMVTIYFRESLE